MRFHHLPLVTTLASISLSCAAADVPVRRVVLFSSGVGYFEHAGTVNGVSSAELRFKTEQINDVLKSLVVEDRDNGVISTVAYPSQDPLAKSLKSFQLDLSGTPSLGNLLAQLRGAHVTVTTADQTLSGTVLGVETQKRIVGERGDAIETVMLNLLSDGKIRAIPMDAVRDLELSDASLRDELAKALATIAQARDQGKKPVTIHFKGQGERRVRLGYVVEAPIWKTSYRLILGDEPELSRLQGWAIIENQTDSDWKDVQLTLVSGRPISFIQDLYRPLYIQRPVFVPDLIASLGPVAYDSGLSDAKSAEAFAQGGRNNEMAKAAMRRERSAAPAAPALAMAADEAGFAGAMDPTAGVQSAANAEKLGEFFHYSVTSVDLERQRSAMLPIVTDPIRSERVSIYNASVQAKHPLLGARVTNTTGKHLHGGPITVFDGGGYAGDARIEDLPPGQERLLSFAVDLQVRVISEGRSQTSTVLGGKLVKGVLQIQRKHTTTQTYEIANTADKTRDCIIEHTLIPGWTLVSEAKPFETTETLYRFRDSVEAGKTSKLEVSEEHVDWEGYSIVDWDADAILSYQRNGRLPQPVRDALAKAAALKQALTDSERQIHERQAQIDEIAREQQRIRENMRTVDAKTAYHQRLLTKLNDQETRIDQLRQEQDALRNQVETKRSELEAYLGTLSLE